MNYQERKRELENHIKRLDEENRHTISERLEEFSSITTFDVTKEEIFVFSFYIPPSEIEDEIVADIVYEHHPNVVEGSGKDITTFHEALGPKSKDYNAVVSALSSYFDSPKKDIALMLMDDCICTTAGSNLTFTLIV